MNKIRENLRAEIRRSRDAGGKPCSSRVEEVHKDKLVLAQPISSGALVAIPLGEEIEVKFCDNKQAFVFKSRIINFKRLPLPVMEIEMPVEIEKIQRRDYVRFQVNLPLEFRPAVSLDNFARGNTLDLSGGGLLFITNEIVRENELLELRIHLPDYTINAIGRVVRMFHRKKGISTVSIRFEKLREVDRERIIKFILPNRENCSKKVCSSNQEEYPTMVKVMVVDDSAFMRRIISDLINCEYDLNVIATAQNGRQAIEMLEIYTPDVITMDIEMPEMDGLQALEHIMRNNPIPVVMLSSYTQSGADATMKALDLGAVDFVTKPSGRITPDIEKVAAEITSKIRVAAGVRDKLKRLIRVIPETEVKTIYKVPLQKESLNKLILIGTSTGGPKALHEVISNLPKNLEAAVLVVQHMPPAFTRSLAERLNTISRLKVKEAEDGDLIQPGCVYIAPGDYHLKVKRLGDSSNKRLIVQLTQEPPVNGHRPAVDAMILSVVEEFWGPIMGVIMTGMGQDGTKGAEAIKQKGGKIIAEDKSTCIVFGMPKAVIEAGNADRVVPLPEIAREITRML